MDDSFPVIFRIFQVLVPTIAVIIFCAGFCKCFLQRRRRRREQRQEARSSRPREAPSSVFVIPFPLSEEHHGPPQHSGDQHYAPPPPYNELMAKPDFPQDPPPAYSEAVTPPFILSHPDQITPSCPARPE